MRGLLPAEPTSIAAMAALVAEGEWVEDLGGSERSEDEEREQGQDHKSFDGMLFSLGWWDAKGREGFRYGVDVGRAGVRQSD